MGPDAGDAFDDLADVLAFCKGDLYLENDVHWNQRGQRVAGLALLRFLEERGLFAPGRN